MSDRLALSAALSVLMMSAFVLFTPASARDELGPRSPAAGLSAPSVSAAIPGLR